MVAESLPAENPASREGLGRRSGRRIGDMSAVDLEGLASATVSAQVDALGPGPYQIAVLIGVGCAALSESIEMGAAAPLHTALAQAFNLSTSERAMLPAVTFGGSAAGILLAGLLCDRLGRKGVLVFSNLAIAMVMTSTALLPAAVDNRLLLALRFLAGLGAAVGLPAGTILVVESTPQQIRAKMMFAIVFLSSIGYLVDAIGLHALMPGLGEGEHDAWRPFCLFIAAPALISLPFVLLLCESPCFLAVKGEASECAKVLNTIARFNGRPPVVDFHVPLPRWEESNKGAWTGGLQRLGDIVHAHAAMLLLLSLVDGSRAFFTSGSAYLWKDLFAMTAATEGSATSPSVLNVVASISPLVGMVIGERFLWLGVRRLALICCLIAVVSLTALTSPMLRSSLTHLLCLVLFTKLVYGPLVSCVNLIKAESFPTEIRASAYSLISISAKLACIVAPTLIEAMKEDGSADGWNHASLRSYLHTLIAAVSVCGFLAMLVPGRSGDGVDLQDYVESQDKGNSERQGLNFLNSVRSYGSLSGLRNASTASIASLWDIWELDGADDRSQSKERNIPRASSPPWSRAQHDCIHEVRSSESAGSLASNPVPAG